MRVITGPDLQKNCDQTESYFELRWVMVMFAFRMVMVARVGDQVYSDEQEYFYCNTNTPGCNQVCSDFLILSLVQSGRSKIVKVDGLKGLNL